jgi:hypothetical protein
MSDPNVLPAGLTDAEKAEREVFLRFHHAELKDVYKQALALYGGVFALAVTFGRDARAGAEVSRARRLLAFSPFALFFVALLVLSAGYYLLSVSGDKATTLNLWRYWLRAWDAKSYRECAIRATTLYQVAGACFLLGLLLLAIVAVT